MTRPSRHIATWSETRFACARLCVTMITVIRSRSETISSSILAVERGSRAEHGSSISTISGVALQRVLDLLPQPRALQRLLHGALELRPARPPTGLLADGEGHVLEDRH